MKKIVVLTGAGISAESGISTFRDSDGLWEQYRVEDVATHEAYLRNPELVLNFYNERRRQLFSVKPNASNKNTTSTSSPKISTTSTSRLAAPMCSTSTAN